MSRTVPANTSQNMTWGYDRWGNRLSQNASGFNVDTTTNQVSTSGYLYDAAGNMTQDGGTALPFHKYTYDAEGNITQVDTGSTAQYVYNSLNQRVHTTVGSASTDFVFNASGQRVSTWDGGTHSQTRGQYYWGSKPVAYYTTGTGAATHFQHQDWVGTERMRTTYNGVVEASYTSLPFGDAQTASPTGVDGDQYHYGMLDYDSESGTDHAQFRQYSSTQGRWMRPDPYLGSYNAGDPQSFNRYVYARNSPLANTDELGLASTPQWITQQLQQIDGSSSFLDSGFDEFAIFDIVNGGNGTYSYASDIWDDAMSNGYGGGVTNGSGDELLCANGSVCGNVWQILAGLNFPTSQMMSGQVYVVPGAAPNNAPPNNPCPAGTTPHTQRMLVTGYDNSYQSTGKNPGDPHYGQTTSGAMAGPGTIAAPRTFSFGTQMFIPGYGLGTVLDRGGAIRNSHIDLWFPSTQQAFNWGAQHLQVTVCR